MFVTNALNYLQTGPGVQKLHCTVHCGMHIALCTAHVTAHCTYVRRTTFLSRRGFVVREGFKNPRHGHFPWRGGGVPPFSVNFFQSISVYCPHISARIQRLTRGRQLLMARDYNTYIHTCTAAPSSRPEGPKAGPKGRNLEVGARRAPRLLVSLYI